MSADPTFSPLQMVARAPAVHALIGQLTAARGAIGSGDRYRLAFSRSRLEDVRGEFAASIRDGEAKLHRLCELLASTLFQCPYDLQSVVIGEAGGGERFTLKQPLSKDLLYAETDLDLGTRLLNRIRMRDGDGWAAPRLVANFIEYQPHRVGPHGTHEMTSRIKAEEELWNKVVDEIFALDRLVDRDKELRPLSRYVKDVFGVKIIVGDVDDVDGVQAVLRGVRWDGDVLDGFDLPHGFSLETLDFLEVKDHTRERRKDSGWEAVKSVVRWWGGTFELQVQPLENYYRERERLTRESHLGHKQRREQLRDVVARRDPVFAFYRDLLQWLFRDPDAAAPELPGVAVEVGP